MPNDAPLSPEIHAAFDRYQSEKTASAWTALSQLWVRDDVDVLDAVQMLDPEFPDPLPLNADGVIEDEEDLYQWSRLPDPAEVYRAISAVRSSPDSPAS
jgi:hypothetical protein